MPPPAECLVEKANFAPMDTRFSILIPTWNNLPFLRLCIVGIEKNSAVRHQVIVHVNGGDDGTLAWVRERGIAHTHTPGNVGVCWALNMMRPLVETDYILYMNDDMYALPGWDTALAAEIAAVGHKMFFLSATVLQPRPFYCKSVIGCADYGSGVGDFDEERLLAEYMDRPHADWAGATWPPNVVHRDVWDLVGGYSVEFSPGMYSDPDFSAKLWKAGVRVFKGVGRSRVYHFEARSTGRVRKNPGSLQFLRKWGITSGSFVRDILHRGEPYSPGVLETPARSLGRDRLRSRLKAWLCTFKKTPGITDV